MRGLTTSGPGEAGLAPPQVWIFFGDLMAALFGLCVLFLVWAMTFQIDLTQALAREHDRRMVEQHRREALERAVAGPLSRHGITLIDGRIGIRGSVLFELNSAELQSSGRTLLAELAGSLGSFLSAQPDQMIMVSGYTDDLPYLHETRRYADNWELSTERALTVTRSLVQAGLPAERVFAAGFGPEHPVVANSDDDNRARNRRVEIVPVPRSQGGQAVGTGTGRP